MKPQKPWARSLGLFGVIVTDLVGYTTAGAGLGYLAHIHLGVPKGWMIITTLLGFSAALWQLYRLVAKQHALDEE